MKEEWKVYIKGAPDRGEEVIKALEERGAENGGFWECNREELIYFINHDGYIDSIDPNCELGRIIIDNYREIKLPELWKDGDILVDNDNPNGFVVKRNIWNDSNFKAYLFVNQKFIQERPIVTFCDKNYHKADSEEVRQFYELLHKHGKDWDAEKNQLIDWRWKPGMGEMYWVVYANSNIVPYKWDNDSIDNNYFDFGNCFKTKEEAEAMAEKIKKLLKGEQL